MEFTAEQIATLLEGAIDGNPNVSVSNLAKIEEAKEGDLSFLANPKYTPHLYTTNASICIVNKNFEPDQTIKPTLIRVDDAYKAFSTLLQYYNQIKHNKQGIETPSYISDTASYGNDCYIGAFAYIGNNVKIGDRVKIYPNTYIGDNSIIGDDTILFSGVKIYSETQIGKQCIIHSGAVIGADGFGFAPSESGIYEKVPQIGNVIIENNVEIGATTTIDRATLGSTIIREGVKLDNQIQIAHNVEIGAHTAIAAQTGIAGSTKIGKHCLIGGQVGIVGHLVIGDGVQIQAQSGITRNLKDKEKIQGTPAMGYTDFNKSYVHFRNLPKIVTKINQIEKKLNSDG